MGLLESLDELFGYAAEEALERQRARTGARMLGPSGRAIVEKVLSGRSSQSRTQSGATPIASGIQTDRFATSPEQRTPRPQQRQPRAAAGSVVEGQDFDPDAISEKVRNATPQALRGRTRDETFSALEASFADRSAAPTTEELVEALRTHRISPNDTPRDDPSAPVGQRLRELARPLVDGSSELRAAATHARAATAPAAARMQQIASEGRSGRPMGAQRQQPEGE